MRIPLVFPKEFATTCKTKDIRHITYNAVRGHSQISFIILADFQTPSPLRSHMLQLLNPPPSLLMIVTSGIRIEIYEELISSENRYFAEEQ